MEYEWDEAKRHQNLAKHGLDFLNVHFVFREAHAVDRGTVSESDIRRYTAAELDEVIARGESKTDWARVEAMTEEELEASIASDPDWKDVPADWWKDAVLVVPPGKKLLSVRFDADVLEWFRATGPGYQTRMNAVLRAYVEQKRRA